MRAKPCRMRLWSSDEISSNSGWVCCTARHVGTTFPFVEGRIACQGTRVDQRGKPWLGFALDRPQHKTKNMKFQTRCCHFWFVPLRDKGFIGRRTVSSDFSFALPWMTGRRLPSDSALCAGSECALSSSICEASVLRE